MNTIELKFNKGFRWYQTAGIYVKGYLTDKADRYYSDKKLLEYFKDIHNYIDLEERVKYASGVFSVIVDTDDNNCYIAADTIRSFPLFYLREGKHWIISDDAYHLAGLQSVPQLNPSACKEFLATGYVTGNETLIKGIRQVQAGEILNLGNRDIRQKFYFSFHTPGVLEYDYNERREKSIKLFDNAFEKFISSLNGRTVLVSLSGGYDSRLIAVMLKKYNYHNVICMTYGRENNPDMLLATKVAEKLDFRLLKIIYDENMIRGFPDNDFVEFYRYSSNLTSMFFLQDYFAARHIKEKALIPDDTVVALGHSGDFLGGSQLNKHGNVFSEESYRELANRIFFTKYIYKRPHGSLKEKIIQRIEKSLQEKYTDDNSLAYSIHEDWDFKEKLAKFNFNSANTYTFFGYEFRFPFWDTDLIEFFRDLPLEARINKYLYNDVLISHYFDPYKLNFDYELEADERMIQRRKNRDKIKYYLPESIKRLFIRRNDRIYYNEITDYLIKDAFNKGRKIKTYGNSYNSIIIQWYLNETEKWIASQQKL